jgi:hypothetical protein
MSVIRHGVPMPKITINLRLIAAVALSVAMTGLIVLAALQY